MNVLQRVFYRVFQTAFHLALPVLPYREPRRFDRVEGLEPLFRELRIGSVLLVTDAALRTAGVTRSLEQLLASLPERTRQAYEVGLVTLEQLEDLDRVVTIGEASEML